MNILSRFHLPPGGARVSPALAPVAARQGLRRPVAVVGSPGAAVASFASCRSRPPLRGAGPVGPVVFKDPASYECMTGDWSRRVGEVFLQWLALPPGQRWLDVGAGTGAVTRLILERCSPASVDAVDAEPAQVEFARRQAAGAAARFVRGDATCLPFGPGAFDVAVMALVLVFLPDPARGVREMVRVLAPGGTACAYNWDMAAGGSPLSAMGKAMREVGVPAAVAPSEACGSEAAIRRLWEESGLNDVQSRSITVHRRFGSVDAAWQVCRLGASTAGVLAGLDAATLAEVKARFAANLQHDGGGQVRMQATAVAVRGVVGG